MKQTWEDNNSSLKYKKLKRYANYKNQAVYSHWKKEVEFLKKIS